MNTKDWLRENAGKVVGAVVAAGAAAFAVIFWDWVATASSWLVESWNTPRWLLFALLFCCLALASLLAYGYRKYAQPPLRYSDADIVAILTSWFGHNRTSKNTQVIHFRDLDRSFRFKPGSTKRHVKTAAAKYHYVVQCEGDETIKFIEGANYYGY